MANEATIVRAPGYPEHFKAKVVPGLESIPARDGRGELTVITWGDDDEVAVVPAQCVVMGSVDLVKRLEIDYDWTKESWGVRHAFGGPFIWYGSERGATLRVRLKTFSPTLEA